MNKRVLRYDVRLNGAAHEIPAGPILLFARGNRNRYPGMEQYVDVWVECLTPDGWPEVGDDPPKQQVAVYGTGGPIPEDAKWLASMLDGEFVHHLYRVSPAPLSEILKGTGII